MDVVTGYKRSYRVVVRKMLNDEILSGYPKVYPTATDVANGYFVLGGAHIPIMTDNELQTLTQSEYAARIALLKDYVIQQEGMNPFANQFNENVVYDPTNCVPQEITTTTTEEITTTTTEEETTTTTSTTTSAPVTSTTTTVEITTTTTTAGIEECTSCVEYGFLYNWYATQGSGANSISSSDDWEVPLSSDFFTLGTYLGLDFINSDISHTLIEDNINHWTSGGSNTTGLTLVGAGERSGTNGIFAGLQEYGFLWAKDLDGDSKQMELYFDVDYVWVTNQSNILAGNKWGNSIRLVNNNTNLTNGQTGTYTGNDGKVYCTICIGTQEWLSENLAETQLRDNSPIQTIESNATWAAQSSSAKCAYSNTYTNVGCGEVAPV